LDQYLLSQINQTSNPYMEPQEFPEAVRDTSKPFPSEEIGFSVHGNTLYQTWLKTVDKILRYGIVKQTESGTNQKELQNISWTIENEDNDNPFFPDLPPRVSEHIGFTKDAKDEYKKIFLDTKLPKGVVYTYGNRLGDYIGKVNQIEEMIQHIKKHAGTRRAVAITFYPPEDIQHTSPPCLTFIQILTTADNRINMIAMFRSHDIMKAAIPNSFGLLNLHEFISQNTSYKRGKLSIISTSAHIYEEEWEMAEDIVKCGIRERIKIQFDEKTDTDPRGYTRIRIRDDKIVLELVTPLGEVLHELVEDNARAMIMKLAKLDLLSRPDHYADVTIELIKAEIAMKKKIPYLQDRVIEIDGITIK
ncbi:MAG TPA: thymidylate synthase, partial [Candidatus Nitrosocosmicus sp.]|nr:thymidylate synthase [Candidatus Nitrosocosmicus sp.]